MPGEAIVSLGGGSASDDPKPQWAAAISHGNSV